MGTGYTRNDVSNNIADGNIISASDIDGEYDAIEAAFNSSTGHTHDGTAAEGAAITVVGPVQDLVVSATEVKPKTTNTLDLGTSALLYKDAYLQGNMYFRDTALKIVSSADGQLDIDADVELEVVAPTVDIDASTALTVDTASTTFTSTLFNVTGSANITGDLDVDNINIDGNTIISTDTNGAINITPNGTGAVNITATTNITGDLDVDNININGNAIISTDTNGNIALTPNGTGEVDISKVDIASGEIDGTTIGANSAAAGTFTTLSATTLGSAVDLNSQALTNANIDSGAIDGVTLGTNSAVTEAQVDNININGNTISSTDTNGNITLTPNGTGEVDISKVDIDSGAIDGTTIGASSAAAITGTTITGTSFVSSGDMTFGDNDKAIFGAGSDLQIYTDGTSNDYIDSATSHVLQIRGSDVRLGKYTGETFVRGAADGAVTLYYDNAIKLATTATGVDVTGTLTSDGLTVDTNTLYVDSTNNRVGIGTTSPGAKIDINSSTEGDIYFRGGTGGTRQLKLSTFATGSNHAGHDFDIGSGNGEFSFSINGSEAMRIDSSGNVGIGTSSPDEKMHVFAGSAGTVSASGNADLVIENSANSGVNILTPNNQNGQILFGDPDDNDVGRLQYNHTSNFMAFYTNANERMRIDSSGNVGIGTSSPSGKLNLATGASAACELRLTSNNTGSGAGDRGRIVVYSSKNDGTAYEAGKIEIDRSTGTTTEAHMLFATNGGSGNTERMRITASGELLVGTTSVIGGSALFNLKKNSDGWVSAFQVGVNGNFGLATFNAAGANVGGIVIGASATTYSTSSDYRLKENIADADDAGSKIDAIQVRQFDWIADGTHQDYGMVAQELQTVAPEAVSGNPDSDEMMGVDYSKLVPMLIKEVQSLRARVAELENN